MCLRTILCVYTIHARVYHHRRDCDETLSYIRCAFYARFIVFISRQLRPVLLKSAAQTVNIRCIVRASFRLQAFVYIA